MSAPDTGYHAPIVLADERERRARKQRPYPAVFELPAQAAQDAAEAREEDSRRFRFLGPAALVAVVLLLALVWWLVRLFLHR